MATQIYYIRPPSVGLAYEDWRDEAPCDGLPHELFELQDFDEVGRGKQGESIAEGLKVCSGCPVRASCKANSNELDRYWTTRGGQPPEGLFPDSKRPAYTFSGIFREAVAPGEGPKKVPKARCKRDHDDWFVSKDGRRRCHTCQTMRNRAR